MFICREQTTQKPLQKPYPENYQQTAAQVVKENKTGYPPLLKTKIDSIEKYDIVFVGFSAWDMQMPTTDESFYINMISEKQLF